MQIVSAAKPIFTKGQTYFDSECFLENHVYDNKLFVFLLELCRRNILDSAILACHETSR